jgi:hypothetical protein
VSALAIAIIINGLAAILLGIAVNLIIRRVRHLEHEATWAKALLHAHNHLHKYGHSKHLDHVHVSLHSSTTTPIAPDPQDFDNEAEWRAAVEGWEQWVGIRDPL